MWGGKYQKDPVCLRHSQTSQLNVNVTTSPQHCSNIVRTFCVSWDLCHWAP
uniref:Uncharacterized protein n=1 Tax=Anguilla anguilla TaxID=7936 RepID=A0A0E9SLS1_ANGAN